MENAQKMVLIDFNEYKHLLMRNGESSTSGLSRQMLDVLNDKSINDQEKIFLYNKMKVRSKALSETSGDAKEKFFESTKVVKNDDFDLSRDLLFLNDAGDSRNPEKSFKRKIDFSTPRSSEKLFKTPTNYDLDGDEHEGGSEEHLKRMKDTRRMKRKSLIKPEKNQKGSGIQTWTMLK